MTRLPATMTAIAIEGKGGPEVLKAVERPVPVPGPSEVLIKVAAAGVNRPDVLQRKGLYPAPKGHSDLPGLEAAGEIVAAGAAVQGLAVGAQSTAKQHMGAQVIGTHVMALLNGGGYAQYCVADAACCIPIPDDLATIQAAAMPETFFTVWHNVFERGALRSGETLLVHGGTSGIGVTAIQLAKAFGASVYATAGSAAKCDACLNLGADTAIDYSKEDFAAVIKDKTDGRGVDVILDMVGGDYIERNIRSLADDGRLVNIAFQKGSTATIDFMRVMLKRLTLTGSTLRIRSAEVKGDIARKVAEKAVPLVARGTVRVPIDSSFALTDAAAAHARMEAGQHIGKIVLTVA